jgi:hypothetical protein
LFKIQNALIADAHVMKNGILPTQEIDLGGETPSPTTLAKSLVSASSIGRFSDGRVWGFRCFVIGL